MKKILKISSLLLAGSMTFLSCDKSLNDEVNPDGNGGNFGITASRESVEWSEGDLISIRHAKTGSDALVNDGKFKFSNDGNNLFKGNVSEKLTEECYDWYAVYPYKEGSEYILGSASDQSQKQNGLNSKKHLAGTSCPYAGKALNVVTDKHPSIQMTSLLATVAISVKNTTSMPYTINSVEFTAPENIIGAYEIDLSYDNFDSPLYTAKGGAVSKTAKLEVANAEIPAGQTATFYLAIKPFTAKAGKELRFSVNGNARNVPVEEDKSYPSGSELKLDFELKEGLVLNDTESDIVLDYAEKDTKTVEFNWSAIGVTANKFTLSLSLNEDMSNAVETEIKNHALTHAELQTLLKKLEGVKLYAPNKVWWNIKAGDTKAEKPSSFNLTEMMVFKDVRGSETQVYRVTRLNYPNGKSVVWTAENLRTTRFNDGTTIDADQYLDAKRAVFGKENDPYGATRELEEDVLNTYGVYYRTSIDKQRLAAKGWKIPSKADWEELFAQAAEYIGERENHGFDILKDKKYYAVTGKSPYADEWGLSLCTAGEWEWQLKDGEKNKIIHDGDLYTYFIHTDSSEQYLVHDCGPTLWDCGRTGAPSRMIMIEE